MKRYCLGFVCDTQTQEVLLIEKRRPEWQAGHFNGIGGKVEGGESALEAMIRECLEETGLEEVQWSLVGQMTDNEQYHVAVFLGIGSVGLAQTLTDETVHRIPWDKVLTKPLVQDVNIIWLSLQKELKELNDGGSHG